ncbi:ErmCL family antibiotic resistance leader peptide [Pseudogracilibacillus sp. SE30717A]
MGLYSIFVIDNLHY